MTALAVIGVGLAVYQSRSDIAGLDRPSSGALAVAVVLSVLVSVSAAYAWSALFERDRGPELRRALYVSQLSKYLPLGGFFQAAGQVGLSNATDPGRQNALIKFPISMLLASAASLASSGYALFVADQLWWVGLFALAAPFLIWRPLIVWLLSVASRIVRRDLSPESTPKQSWLVRSFFWSAFTIHCSGIVLWVLIRSLGSNPSVALCIAAFGVAWAAGTAVVPLPSGFGVREAVLVAIVASVAGQTVLAAALLQRLVSLLAEVLTAVAVRAGVRTPATSG